MPRHRTRVTETKINVAMSIFIVEMRTLCLADKGGECPGPLRHPVHGNAAKQRLARPLKQSLGFRMLVYKSFLLALHEGLQAGAVNGAHEILTLSYRMYRLKS